MRISLLPVLAIAFLPLLASAQESVQTPLSVVDKRTKAMADRNFPDFMSTYAENVEIFVYPDRPLGKGKEHIRKLFAPMFEKGDVEISVSLQLVSDSFVVSESITSFSDKSETTVAIYEVRNGLIQSVRFLRDQLRAPQSKRNTKK
jgi:hypothetical protein